MECASVHCVSSHLDRTRRTSGYFDLFNLRIKTNVILRPFLYSGFGSHKLNFMRRIIGIILIVTGIAVGAHGISTLTTSKESLEVADVEIAVKDSSQRYTSYVLIGLGVVTLIAGVYVMSTKTRLTQ